MTKTNGQPLRAKRVGLVGDDLVVTTPRDLQTGGKKIQSNNQVQEEKLLPKANSDTTPALQAQLNIINERLKIATDPTECKKLEQTFNEVTELVRQPNKLSVPMICEECDKPEFKSNSCDQIKNVPVISGEENNKPSNQPYPFELPTIFDSDCQLTLKQKLELVEGYDSVWPYLVKGWRKEEEEWLDFLDDGRDYYEYEDYFSEDSMDRVRKKDLSYYLNNIDKGNDGYYSDEYCY